MTLATFGKILGTFGLIGFITLAAVSCATIPASKPMKSGAPTSPPPGCEDLREREGKDSC